MTRKTMNGKLRLLGLAVLALCLCASGALASEENLLDNGGFERQESGWPVSWQEEKWLYDVGVTFMELRDTAFDGTYCAMVENVDRNDARFVQEVAVEPNTVYLLSGWVRVEGCDPNYAGASLSIIGTYASFPYIYDTDGEWVYTQAYIRTDKNHTAIRVGARLGDYSADNVGKAYFDNLSLIRPAEVPAGADIIQLYDYTSSAQVDDVTTASADENLSNATILLAVLAFGALLAVLWVLRVRNVPVPQAAIFVLLLLAAVLRLYLMATQPGYDTDMNCFLSWSMRMAEVGPNEFYSPDIFCDYPPGYMYPLWLTGLVMRATGVTQLDELGRAVVKLVPLLADLAAIALIWRLARKRLSNAPALLLAALYALSPAILIDGAMWGQVDSVVALGLLITLALVLRGNWRAALPVFTVTVLMKPQALIAGPVGLTALVLDMLPWKEKGRKTARDAGIGLGISLAVAAAMLLPFLWGKQAPLQWIIDKYVTTLDSYQYATLNTANLMYLLGGNWQGLDVAVGPLTYGTLGTGCMLLAIAAVLVLFIRRRDRTLLPFFCAMIYIVVYVFGIKMHERYLFPALLLLLYAYIVRRDWRLLLMFVGFSITFFVNCALVLRDIHLPYGVTALGGALAVINLALCGVGFWLAADRKQRLLPAYENANAQTVSIALPSALSALAQPTPDEGEPVAETIEVSRATARRLEAVLGRTKPVIKMRRRDWVLMLGLTVVYAAIGYIGLGATAAPQTPWTSSGKAEYIVFDLGESKDFSFMYYNGINSRDYRFDLEVSDDGVVFSDWMQQSVTPGTCFRWQYARTPIFNDLGEVSDWTADNLAHPMHGRYVRLTATSPGMTVFEVAFQDADGNPLPATISQSGGGRPESVSDPALLIDEQDTVPEYPSYYNGTYFDEIYHARTGYEHANGMSTYEWTHPPLGKVFIMIGIRLFGMTPFGWRFFGVLMGVLMVPAMYLLGKLLFRRTRLAFLAAFVMAFDMMHLTQTRIATIDSYAVLFIILMYLCMFWYMRMSLFRDGLRTLIPLGLSGLFMGLGCASKWTCMYAAVGLAVLFFWTVLQRFLQWRAGMKAGGLYAARVQKFPRHLLITLGFCLIVFIVIPFAIYYFSYIPQFAWEGGLTWDRFWDTQTAIFDYHANLVDDHSFQSPWYEWPLMLKPMYYFNGKPYIPTGMVSTIMCMGNPAVWWAGFAAFLFVAWRWLRPHLRGEAVDDHRPALLLISFAAQYLPWVLVPRSMFIYHYFGSLPFVMLSIVYAFEKLYEWKPARAEAMQSLFMAVVLVMFIGFYPIGTGVQVSQAWAERMNWLNFIRLPYWKAPNWLYF